MTKGNESKSLYASAAEVESVVRNFEDCTTQPSDFKHHAHLTVALWYLSRLSMADATARMRESLFRFLNHYKEHGYNETITVFWLKVVRNFLDNQPEARDLAELSNELAATYRDSRLIFDYYSKELLASKEAKEGWIEPDMKPLDL
jgi:hypothetical protein